MDPNPSLPFVAAVDDTDEAGDVLDVLALAPFVAGQHQFAKTLRLSRVRPDAELVPSGAARRRTAEAPWRTVTVAEGQDWVLKLTRWNDGSATVSVTATSAERAEEILSEVTEDVFEPEPPADTAIPVGFWHLSGRGAQCATRSIDIHRWSDIRRNYTAAAALALDELMSTGVDKLSGRLLLLYGPPGTGKTSVVQAVAHSWRDWCRVECVVDPEVLLRNAGYLTSVMLGESDDDQTDRWRLLVLEDCDELIRADAKTGTGQALSRLLNLTDGLLGQGRNVLVAITTNEDFTRFHPAVTRPGRCMARIEIGRLSSEEAGAWLGDRPTAWPTGASLAELFAARDGRRVVGRDGCETPATGLYM